MKDGAILELVIGPGISLVHDPGVQQGKTSGMGKGLFLRAGERLCAGESAGIGLPVLKSAARTVFPSCARVEMTGALSMEKTFNLDKTLQWRMGGARTTSLFPRVLERIAGGFMRFPALQQRLLVLRTTLFQTLGVTSSMAATEPEGSCSIAYEASPGGLLVRVDSSGLEGKGTVILLNELEGSPFTRISMDGRVLEGRDIPAWQRASFGDSLESPLLGLSVSLAPGPGHTPGSFRLFCGREQGWILDWAGMALTCSEPVFSYRVLFSSR